MHPSAVSAPLPEKYPRLSAQSASIRVPWVRMIAHQIASSDGIAGDGGDHNPKNIRVYPLNPRLSASDGCGSRILTDSHTHDPAGFPIR